MWVSFFARGRIDACNGVSMDPRRRRKHCRELSGERGEVIHHFATFPKKPALKRCWHWRRRQHRLGDSARLPRLKELCGTYSAPAGLSGGLTSEIGVPRLSLAVRTRAHSPAGPELFPLEPPPAG